MRVFVIAEAGVNHNGNLEQALQLVDEAAAAGADAVKFQAFRAKELAANDAPKTEYQNTAIGADSTQAEMLKELELSESAFRQLSDRCGKVDIEFLASAFDIDSLDMLVSDLNMKKIKMPSGEITNGPLLLSAAKFGLPIILSTGMSSISEITNALGVIAFGYTQKNDDPNTAAFASSFKSIEGQKAINNNVTLLQCTSEYPTPDSEVNLNAMNTLSAHFGLPCGLSDHTAGGEIALAATALKAPVIEKHFTLDRNAKGPDHAASLEPDELKRMIVGIRRISSAMGNKKKEPTGSESKNEPVVRRSLAAKTSIKAGQFLSSNNLTSLRPGNGISPMHYWDYIGRSALRDYQAGEAIDP